MNCECGYKLIIFLCVNEKVPETVQCPICLKEHEVTGAKLIDN